MNRYRIGLTVLVVLFLITAIFSSVVGVGLFKGLLILVGLTLLTIILIGGMVALRPGPFWWNYFKPVFANPVAWGFLHLAFALLFWEASGEIWKLYWKPLLALELSVFVLCAITNKEVLFEKRLSRLLLEMQFVYVFIIAGAMICISLFWGEFAANLNRAAIARLMTSRLELTLESMERSTKDHQAKPFQLELKELVKESKKRLLSKRELKKAAELKAKINGIYEVPLEKRIDWEKLGPRKAQAEPEPPQPKPPRLLIATFKLPASGDLVSKDDQGRELKYRKGEVGRYKQLSSPLSTYVIDCRSIGRGSYTVKNRIYVTGVAPANGKVELRAAGEKPMLVQVQIFPYRSRKR